MKKLFIIFILGIIFSSLVFATIHPDLNMDQEEISVIISLKERVLPSHVYDLVNENAKIKHEFNIINAVSAKIPRNALDKISKLPFVEYIEPDYQVNLVLDKGAYEIQSTYVWENNISGKNINVAILDTGIFSHNSLNILKQIDFTGEGTNDLNGHGTHIAGIIASKDIKYTGVAFDANLFNVKVLNQYGSGYASDVIKGIEWAVDNGANIISLSLGAQLTNCDGTDAVSRSVDKASEKSIVIVAAGNLGPGEKTISSPGCAKQAITVGATEGNNVASFSSRGPTADNRIKPDVVAPGVRITSTWINNEFKSLSGTSMATPFVSGLIALLLEQDSTLTTSDLKEILSSSSTDLDLNENIQGYGKINAYEAYLLLSQEEIIIEEPENETIIEEPEEEVIIEEPKEEKPKKVIERPSRLGRGLGRAWERIQLTLTFNSLKKAELHLEFAEKRLNEFIKLENSNNLIEYEENLNKANSLIEIAKNQGRDVSKTSLNLVEKTLIHEEILNEVLNIVPEQARTNIENAINLSRFNIEENLFVLEDSNSEKAIPVNLKIAEKALEVEQKNINEGKNISLDEYNKRIDVVDKVDLIVEPKQETQESIVDSSIRQKEILTDMSTKANEQIKPVITETIQKVEQRKEKASTTIENVKRENLPRNSAAQRITGRIIAWIFH